MASANPFTKSNETKNKQKLGLVSKLIILFVILSILVALTYAWVQVKHPDWIDVENQSLSSPPHLSQETPQKSTIWRVLLWIGLSVLVFIVGIYIYRGIRRTRPLETGEFHKIPVSPDRAIILWKDHFCREYGIQSRFDFSKEVSAYVPISASAINITKRRPFPHPTTGEDMLGLEVEIRDGKFQGLHVVVLPLDRGEKTISLGRYVLDTKVNRRGMPLSSPADKQDRIQMAILDRLSQQGQDVSPETLKGLMSSSGAGSNPNSSFSPSSGANIGGLPSQYPESGGGDSFGGEIEGEATHSPSSYYQPQSRYRRRRRVWDSRLGRHVYR